MHYYLVICLLLYLGLLLPSSKSSAVTAENDAAYICESYLAPSLFVGSGVGIYAGISTKQGSSIDRIPTLSYMIHRDLPWMVNKYALEGYKMYSATYGSDGLEEGVVGFGGCMIYNHHEDPHLAMISDDSEENVKRILLQTSLFQHLLPYSVYPIETFQVLRDIHPGDEIFFNYGQTWFENKGIPYKDPASAADKKIAYTLEELAKVGHCASYLRDDTSTIADAGVGMFARKFIQKGELIQVSPLLVHSKFEVTEASDESSVLINYCISRPDSDVALLPIALTALINHGGRDSNAVIEWFFWSEEDRTVLDTDANELCLSNAARLYLGYRATRDIELGEEVTIDYGEEWQREWEEYLEKRMSFKLFEEPLPLFRQSIDAPEGLFPPHWAVECIGNQCEIA